MKRLSKLREPAAIALVAVVAVQLMLAVITVDVYTASQGLGAAGDIAAQQLSPAGVIAAALALAGCTLWGRPTPHARSITLAGAVLFAAQAVLGLLLTLIGMIGPGSALTLAGAAVGMLIPAVASAAAFRLHADLAARSPRQPSAAVDQFPRPNRPTHPVPRSQFDQFGNPHSNSAPSNQDYPNNRRPPVPPPAGPTETWQPVAHNGPQRLEPSPYRSPVGPHSRDELDRGADGTPDRSGTDWSGGPQV